MKSFILIYNLLSCVFLKKSIYIFKSLVNYHFVIRYLPKIAVTCIERLKLLFLVLGAKRSLRKSVFPRSKPGCLTVTSLVCLGQKWLVDPRSLNLSSKVSKLFTCAPRDEISHSLNIQYNIIVTICVSITYDCVEINKLQLGISCNQSLLYL